MRSRTSPLLACVPFIAAFAAGCSDQAQTPVEPPPVTPVYTGGSTEPPKTAAGKTVKNPKIINMTPNTKVVP